MEIVGSHHVAVGVKDLAGCTAFYTEVLGFRVLDTRPDFGIAGVWLQAGTQQLHLVEDVGDAPGSNHHFAMHVDDVEAFAVRLEQHGAHPRRLPYFVGAGRQVFVRDPSGNVIELNQPDRA